ncbi:MAG: hypothetical protein J5803_04050 [Desulfovibrio sp.]|nr:hypothetical protein [Desulfovibrio sp.]
MRFFVFLLFSFCLWPTSSWAYMHLAEYQTYAGDYTKDDAGQKTTLTLLDGHYFVLRQIFFSGDKVFTRDMTGKWRQRDGGAILFLHNDHGLALSLNVGLDNLYGIFPSIAQEQAPLMVLPKVAYQDPEFTLMGTLQRDGKRALLKDSATGRIFTVYGEALSSLPTYDESFVDVEIAYAKSSCRILRLSSQSRFFPKESVKAPPLPFSTLVRDTTWLVTFPSGLTVSCVFAEKQEGRGTFEVSGQGLWLSVPYEQHEASLAFTLRRSDLRMLEICQARELALLLQETRSWEQDGSSLLLCGIQGELALLENARFRRNFGSIGSRRR